MEGTVAANALKYGTGGLNIDDCRIDTADAVVTFDRHPGDRPRNQYRTGTGTLAANPTGKGRWPANLILSHHPACVAVGETKVTPVGATARTEKHGKGVLLNNGGKGKAHPGFRDADGKETITVYDCHEGCPVAYLDEQTGTLTSGQVKPGYMRNASTQPSNGGFHGKFGDSELTGFGDEGGASRFFKQVKGT